MKYTFPNFGIGTDIEDISRFTNLNGVKNKSFLNKIFTKNELIYCFSKVNAAPHLAARYAAKEAVVKAVSNISEKIINYKDIEILNNISGIPVVNINDEKFANIQINVSLSHCKAVAIAFAVAVKDRN